MSRERALDIVKTIESRGFRAYLVGGCVRDLLLGREPGDWDIASSARPEQIMAIFGRQAVPTGVKHGTVTVKAAGEGYEVTTFRTEGRYSDGRHPDSVAFAQTIEEDLERRDFTVNAMAMDSAGGIIDPFGGREDLAQGVIRCVGGARVRFSEDALRILRGIRFASVLGFSVEEDTRRAIHEQAELLRRIAAERILAEMDKLLCGGGCREVLAAYPDVLGVFIPELLPCVNFDQKNIHHCYTLYEHIVEATAAIDSDPVLRWTMLLHDIGKVKTFTVDGEGQGHFYGHPDVGADMAEEICRRLRMRRRDREDIVTLIRWHDRNIPITEKGIGSAVSELGEANFRRLLQVKRADNLAQAPAYRGILEKIDEAEALLDRMLAEKHCLRLKDLAVNGRDIMNLGYSGRAVGEKLEILLQGVISGEIENRREALLAFLAEKE